MIIKLFFNKLFLATVVVPTLLAAVYYGLIASDVYISESSFVVRSPQQVNTSLLGDLFQGAGFSRSQDGSYAVKGFIESRDALTGLDKDLHVKQLYSDKSIDILSRFPGLDWDDSFENFFQYYQKHIFDVEVDSSSTITTLTTRAYSAEDAYRINQYLLDKSEDLINKLNQRGQQDLIEFSTREVKDAEAQDKKAALALAKYRNENSVIDPEAQASIPLQQISKLQDEVISTKSQIIQLETVAKNSPALPSLRERNRLLQREIKDTSGRIAGEGDSSLASKATEFKRLELEKEFADKMLSLALGSLEQARNDAQRKQQYLERISAPSKPDEPMEPRRLYMVFGVFMLGMVSWGVLAMMIAGIREHQE
ncbi:MAG: hypothetical protein GC185_10980 [Alphaproteobacteria bacterium]|nr:hypothetical protein [Alphaproteobacteria bacterium]